MIPTSRPRCEQCRKSADAVLVEEDSSETRYCNSHLASVLSEAMKKGDDVIFIVRVLAKYVKQRAEAF